MGPAHFISEFNNYLDNDSDINKSGGFFAKLEQISGFNRKVIIWSFLGALAVYLVFGYFAELACNLVGFAYPAYATSQYKNIISLL